MANENKENKEKKLREHVTPWISQTWEYWKPDYRFALFIDKKDYCIKAVPIKEWANITIDKWNQWIIVDDVKIQICEPVDWDLVHITFKEED